MLIFPDCFFFELKQFPTVAKNLVNAFISQMLHFQRRMRMKKNVREEGQAALGRLRPIAGPFQCVSRVFQLLIWWL